MSLTDNQQSSYAEEALRKYGYRPEFRRELKRFASFAVGFSFISITTGIFTTYGYVLINSGPLGIWTWPLVIVGQLFVALVFGALASRVPGADRCNQTIGSARPAPLRFVSRLAPGPPPGLLCSRSCLALPRS